MSDIQKALKWNSQKKLGMREQNRIGITPLALTPWGVEVLYLLIGCEGAHRACMWQTSSYHHSYQYTCIRHLHSLRSSIDRGLTILLSLPARRSGQLTRLPGRSRLPESVITSSRSSALLVSPVCRHQSRRRCTYGYASTALQRCKPARVRLAKRRQIVGCCTA